MKTSLKKWSRSRCFKIFRAYCISFNSSYVGNFLSSLISKRLYRSSEKEKKEIRCLVFTSSTKREIRKFHVVNVQWRRRNVQSVMHVHSGCFANLNLLILAVLVDVAVVVACRSHEALRNLFLNWHLKKHLFLAGEGQRSFSVPN